MESVTVACAKTPTEVRAATTADRDTPGVAREPGPFRCLGAVRATAGGRAKAADAKTQAVRVGAGMHVSACDHDAFGRAGHRVTAYGTVETPFGVRRGEIVGIEVGARRRRVRDIQTAVGDRTALHLCTPGPGRCDVTRARGD